VAEWKREEQVFKMVKADFEGYSEDWQRAFKELVDRKSVSGSAVTDPNRFRETGYVYIDGNSGRFYLLGHCSSAMSRLTKGWKPKSAT
jgi:hypothetical protein